MTNVNGCKHIGEKGEKDWSICLGTFRNIDHFSWLKLSDTNESEIIPAIIIEGLRPSEPMTTTAVEPEQKTKPKPKKKESLFPDTELLRNKRLQYFNQAI